MEKDILITNETGLHARPASTFVNAAGKYESDVEIKASFNTVFNRKEEAFL